MKSIVFGVILLSLALSGQFAYSQEIIGMVRSSEDQSELVGVNVLVKGTTIGTVTDIDGIFALRVDSMNTVLVFSYVGFERKEIDLCNHDGTTLIVSLAASSALLDEVVVQSLSPTIRMNLLKSMPGLPTRKMTKRETRRSAKSQNFKTGTPIR